MPDIDFIDLADTPDSLGTAGQIAAVNSAEDGIEFINAPSGGGGLPTGFSVLEQEIISTGNALNVETGTVNLGATIGTMPYATYKNHEIILIVGSSDAGNTTLRVNRSLGKLSQITMGGTLTDVTIGMRYYSGGGASVDGLAIRIRPGTSTPITSISTSKGRIYQVHFYRAKAIYAD